MSIQKLVKFNPETFKTIFSVLDISSDDVMMVDFKNKLIGTYYSICEIADTENSIELLSEDIPVLEIIGAKDLFKQLIDLYDGETDEVYLTYDDAVRNYSFLIQSKNAPANKLYIHIPQHYDNGDADLLENFPINETPIFEQYLPPKFTTLLKLNKSSKEFYFLFLYNPDTDTEKLVGYGNHKIVHFIDEIGDGINTMNKFFEHFNSSTQTPRAYSVQNVFNVKFPKGTKPLFKYYVMSENSEDKIFEISFIHNNIRFRIFEAPYLETIYTGF
jgi:hypothetical protein